MAGGPGGTGDGIKSESLVWAIIMSAFAGASPSLELVGKLTWGVFLAFGGILFGFVNP